MWLTFFPLTQTRKILFWMSFLQFWTFWLSLRLQTILFIVSISTLRVASVKVNYKAETLSNRTDQCSFICCLRWYAKCFLFCLLIHISVASLYTNSPLAFLLLQIRPSLNAVNSLLHDKQLCLSGTGIKVSERKYLVMLIC